jgi:hypothetical protein
VKLTIHLHLVTKLTMHGALPQLPPYVHTECCLIKQQGQIYRYKYAVLWFPPDDGATVISVYYRTRSVHMRALHLPFLPSPLRLVPGLCDVCLPSPI